MGDGIAFSPVFSVAVDVDNEFANSVEFNNVLCVFQIAEVISSITGRSDLLDIAEAKIKKTNMFSTSAISSSLISLAEIAFSSGMVV